VAGAKTPACHWRGRPTPTLAAWTARSCDCPQALAYYSQADVIGFGGAAGGGKSDWELGTALTQHRRTTVFRREEKQTSDLQQRACAILDEAGEPYKVSGNVVYVPREDRQIDFGGIQHADNWRKHRGNARDAFLFDEASEFEEVMIRTLFAWNRSAVAGQRSKIGMCFNPPTIKHGIWLIDYFGPWLDPKHARPAKYGELRWFITVDDKDIELPGPEPVQIETKSGRIEKFIPLSRTFIKSLVDDNEYYAGTDYEAKLMSLPGASRLQLRYGDFNVEEIDEPNQCIPTRWVLLAQERWQAMQEAANTPDGRPDAPLSAVGADPARGGINKTAFVARIGTWFDYPETHPGSETPDGAEVIKRLAKFMSRYRVVRKVMVGMDVIGVGSSPVDEGRRQNMNIIAMGGSEAAPERATDRAGIYGFANLRAYWYWMLREALDPELGQNLAIPPDRDLLADLCAPKYDDKALRGITIEKKSEVAKRLGRSPDKGDAFVYAFAVQPQIVGYESVAKRAPGVRAFAPAHGGRAAKKGAW
jgi:hypothetical protein